MTEATQTIKVETPKISRELDFMYTGFVLIKKIHVVIAFVSILLITATQIGGMVYYVREVNYMIGQLDKRVTSVELVQKERGLLMTQQEAYNNIFLAELQFNLQVLMENQGLNYKQFKSPEVKK